LHGKQSPGQSSFINCQLAPDILLAPSPLRGGDRKKLTIVAQPGDFKGYRSCRTLAAVFQSPLLEASLNKVDQRLVLVGAAPLHSQWRAEGEANFLLRINRTEII